MRAALSGVRTGRRAWEEGGGYLTTIKHDRVLRRKGAKEATGVAHEMRVVRRGVATASARRRKAAEGGGGGTLRKGNWSGSLSSGRGRKRKGKEGMEAREGREGREAKREEGTRRRVVMLVAIREGGGGGEGGRAVATAAGSSRIGTGDSRRRGSASMSRRRVFGEDEE